MQLDECNLWKFLLSSFIHYFVVPSHLGPSVSRSPTNDYVNVLAIYWRFQYIADGDMPSGG